MEIVELPEYHKDIKKLGKHIRSVKSDVDDALKCVSELSALERVRMTATEKLCKIASFSKSGIFALVYKLREGTSNPKTSDRDGVRIWFAIEDKTDRLIGCLVQPCDKNNQKQAETLVIVKQRLSDFYA